MTRVRTKGSPRRELKAGARIIAGLCDSEHLGLVTRQFQLVILVELLVGPGPSLFGFAGRLSNDNQTSTSHCLIIEGYRA